MLTYSFNIKNIEICRLVNYISFNWIQELSFSVSCLIALEVSFRALSKLGLLPPTGAMASDSNWQAEFSCGDRFRGLRQGVPIGELFFADCSCYRP